MLLLRGVVGHRRGLLVDPAGRWRRRSAPAGSYEGGSKQVEDQFIEGLARFFGRPVAPGEPLLRGTHAIGTCTAAAFEVYDAPDELAVGVFAEPRSFSARVR